MKVKKGVTRIVFIFSRIVIKIPNPISGHYNFLQGMIANYGERRFCKMFKDIPFFYNLVVPTRWCSWFGLIEIQERAEEVLKELPKFSKNLENRFRCISNNDLKAENFGLYKGEIRCLDYQ